MTILIASLFLPKTVRLNDRSSSRFRRSRRLVAPVVNKNDGISRIGAVIAEPGPPSLFNPRPIIVSSPDTPEEADQIFVNEDGSRLRFPVEYADLRSHLADEDNSNWAEWGKMPPRQSVTSDSTVPVSTDTTTELPRIPRAHSSSDAASDETSNVASDTASSSTSAASSAVAFAAATGLLQAAQANGGRGVHTTVPATAPDDFKIVNAGQGNARLTSAVMAAVREDPTYNVKWVGTLGIPTDDLSSDNQRSIANALATQHDMLTVFCTDQDFDGHYSHFCKQILWPIFHYQIPDSPKSKAYRDHSWKYYVAVNQAFADKIVAHWKPGDSVWIHDYHLLLVPAMLRTCLPDAKIGFFLHLAFPSSEVFRCQAVRRELLEGVLGANLIGFQIREYARHFLQTCSRILGAEASPDGLQLEDRYVDVVCLPTGIDPVRLNHYRADPEVARCLHLLRDRYPDQKLIVARDKLDEMRGVRQKLLSYELFLNQNPAWCGRVVLIQVALAFREKSDLNATVSDIVTRINSTWGNLTYQPVVFLRQDIEYPQYLALLTIADALILTPQREGMNLTSHEYILCQDGRFFSDKRHGSLIISEFTGSASIFKGGELAVNPWDYHQCANAVKTVLEMPEEKRDANWTALYDIVLSNTGTHWVSKFLNQLDTVYEQQVRKGHTSVPRLSIPHLSDQYRSSVRRLFVLDFEGTLVKWGPLSQIITASLQRSIDVMNELLVDPRNTVYVMSGRSREELQGWFKRLPSLGLIAENGCYVREARKDPSSNLWTTLADMDHIQTWKREVKPILSYYMERAPGSKLEVRRGGLHFDYSQCEDIDSAQRLAADCASHVNDACERQRVHAVTTDSCVVVESLDVTKGSAVEHVFASLADIDFLMVVGDSREDDQVFKWANGLGANRTVAEVVTVTVSMGERNTEATATLTQGTSGVLTTLQRLAALGP